MKGEDDAYIEKPSVKPWYKRDQFIPHWCIYIGWILVFFSIVAPGWSSQSVISNDMIV